MMNRQTRRKFLQHSLAGFGAGILIAGTRATGAVFGANDRIRVGVAGIHGRGQGHISELMRIPGVEVAYLIDPDSSLFESRAKRVEDATGKRPKCVQDIRQALEDPELNAVSVATCNHWHALITFWACQHGKDVYVEKPCSHNVFEGRQCVRAAEKYGRIVQHGTQSRASRSWANTIAAVRSGKYGKLVVAKGYASKPRWSIGFKPVKDPPPHLDYNLWLGPAPWQPYHENLVHYNWHWFWDTGNGEIGNQGVHQMDIARWGIGKRFPKSVISMGGRWVNSTPGHPPFTDQGQTPNMHLAVYDFGDCLLVFEIVGLVGRKGVDGKEYPRKVTNEFYMEEGVIRDGRFFPYGSEKGEPLPDFDVEMGPGNIFENFIQAVRTRDRSILHADITEAHPSAGLCHLGNISYRLGEQVSGTTEPDVLDRHPEIRRSWETIKQTLKGTLGLDLAKTTYRLGRLLKFDPEKEKFIGDSEADKLLTRDYREPFVVTEEV